MTESPDDSSDGLPEIPTRFAGAWAVTSFASALAALFILPLVVGGFGMVAGTIAHLKQSRWGMPGAVASGIALIVGTANEFLLRS